MKIYSVGGSVRDQLLGVEIKDLDYLVVGSTPEELEAANFKKVGQFPVFLHPLTLDEYALARTEVKSGTGYGGFACAFGPDVTLEDDLLRRDLTINAIAKDDKGNLYDPYNGIQDIENRVLRHVSMAFADDPVRVLRVARFMSRYKKLGFNVADETMDLMSKMANDGCLDELTPERIWKELSRALLEDSPEVFFMTLRDCGALAKVFPEIDALFGVEQNMEHHPEGDAGIHTMMVVKRAREISDDLAVIVAGLLHDLGKALTPKDEWPKHISHEINGIPLVTEFCNRLKVPSDIRVLSERVAELHLNSHRLMEMRAGSIIKVIEKLDAFRRPERIEQYVLSCQADAQGRLGHQNKPYPQAELMRLAYVAAKSVSTGPLLERGYKGKKLGEMIRQERIKSVGLAISSFKTEQSVNEDVDDNNEFCL